MTKYLNLDEIKAPEKVLKLNGKEHVLKPLSVEDFIENMREAKEADKKDDVGLDDQIAALVKMILKVFPTLTDAELKKLPMNHLNAILEFARAEDVEAEDKKSGE